MKCSASTLLFDVIMWLIPGLVDRYKQSTINVTADQNPDCLLFSADCDSAFARSISAFDPADYYWVDIILVYTLYTLVVVVGISSNIVNIIIFTKHEIATDSTNSLLCGLAVTDLVSLLVKAMLLSGYFMCFIDLSESLTAANLLINYGNIYRHVNILSLDFVALISLQRAAAVLLPFRVSIIFSHRNTNILMVIMSAICLAAGLSVYSSFKPRWVFHLYFDKYISLGLHYYWGKTFVFDLIYNYLTVHSVICLSVIFVCALLTVIKLRLQAKSRMSMKASSDVTASSMTNREVKVVKLSLVLCLVTFITYSLGFLGNFVIQIYEDLLYQTPVFVWGLMLMLLFFGVNCCFNFFLYIKMSPKFRESVQILFSCKKQTKK